MAQKFPDHPFASRTGITAVILAGGAGSRAGYRDKGTLIWRGRPLIAHVSERIAPQVEKVLISCNRNADFYANYADVTFPDLRTEQLGPVAGLEAAARRVATDYALVVPCDTPLLPRDLAQRLLSALLARELEACYVRSNGREHYLCALVRRECLARVTAYLDGGGRSVRHWLAQFRTGTVEIECAADAFLNINTFDPEPE